MDRTVKAAIVVIVISIIAIFGLGTVSAGAGFIPKVQVGGTSPSQQGSLLSGGAGNSTGPDPGSPAGNGTIQTFGLGVRGTQYSPAEIRVKQGTKVRIEGDTNTLTGCMSTVNIDGYGISKRIQAGDNVIEFTADTAGTFPIHCNMGMGNGKLVVEDSSGTVPVQSQAPAVSNGPGLCC